MGREARQRTERRNKTLTRLAQTNPDLFEQKWNEKLNTWAAEIWCAQREQAHFTFKEYESFISTYPKAQSILADLLRFTNQGYFLYIDKLNDFQKDELGVDAIAELLNRVRQGGLRGEKVFEIADHAQQVLSVCGEMAVALQQKDTAAVLANECCRALAPHIGHEIYTLNHYRKPKE
jgi:hypothetical protein